MKCHLTLRWNSGVRAAGYDGAVFCRRSTKTLYGSGYWLRQYPKLASWKFGVKPLSSCGDDTKLSTQEAMWEKLELPFIWERIVAFSIPQQDVVWVMTWDALFQVTLAPDVSVLPVLQGEEELDKVFDENRSLLTIGGQAYPMLGLYGGMPILTNELGDQLSLEPSQDRLIVLSSERQVKQVIEFSDLSSDWCWATFSADSHYLLIGVPYDLFIYQWRSLYNNAVATD